MVTAAPLASSVGARQEWRAHWLLVLASMTGISVTAIPSATLGLFMGPLRHEFGWSATEISAGLTIFALVSLPLTPFVGVLVDRFGPRRLALPGLLLTGLMFAAFSTLTGALVQWFALWVGYTIATLLIRSVVWSTAVSRAFTASRGLAIAFLLSGTAIATSVSPIASRWLIDSFGWRGAYLWLGLGWVGFALAMCVLFFRDSWSPPAGKAAEPASAPQAHGGLTVKEALRSLIMYRIAVAAFLQIAMIVAIMVHLVPLLIEAGLSRVEAANVAALFGASSIIGNLLTGWLADRVSGALLPVACFCGPALAYFLFLQGSGSTWLLSAAVMLLGYCSGAAFQLTVYMTTRYAGLRSFGTIFGIISTLVALAGGIGPLLAGAVFDLTGSYTALLVAGIPAALISGIAVLRLGPYPEFASGARQAELRPAQ